MTEPRTQQSHQVELHAGDSDLHKGAIEGGPDGNSNANAEGALDEDGWPRDEVAIAQDVLGANEDQTQG
ncbi:MAG: hypothetical protein ACREKH_09360 [Candidatus Rokuibacteriota bacterium]